MKKRNSHQTDPWDVRFEACLKDDHIAKRLVKEGANRARLIRLLQAVSDPEIGARTRQFVEEALPARFSHIENFSLIPSRESALRLSRNLRKDAKALRQFWWRPLFAKLPHVEVALSIADALNQQAAMIDKINWKLIRNRLGYRAVWKQFPLALLCEELQVPDRVSYVELSQLLGVALRAHFRSGTLKSFSPEALRKQQERFYTRPGAQTLKTFNILDKFLKILVPPE
jgi:hypothetical protein